MSARLPAALAALVLLAPGAGIAADALSAAAGSSAASSAAAPGAASAVAAPAAAELTFDQALEAIIARSTAIGAQQAGLGALESNDLPIRLAFTPSLAFDAKQGAVGPVGDTPAYHPSQVEGVAQLNLFRWGADYKNWQAARLDETGQRSRVEDAWLGTQDAAVAALVAFVQRRKEAGVAASIVTMREESLAVSRERYGRGYMPLQEMEKVSVDLANAQARLADAQVLSYAADAALVALLGHARVAAERPWTGRFARLDLKSGPPAVAAELGEEALARLLSARPDWRAAQAKADAEEARQSRDWRLMGPSLDGNFSFGYYYNDYSSYVSPYGPYGAAQWQGGLAVTLPLFDHLTLYSNARAQAFVKSAAEIALEQVRRTALAEWRSARESFLTAVGSAQVRDRTLAVSRRLYQDNLKRLQNGRITADDLVLEQTRLYDSELLAVRGWASAHLAFEQLCKAEGLRLGDCRL